MSQHNQHSPKRRIIILTKGDMIGLLSLGSGEQGTRVISTDRRRSIPSVRVHENRDSAVAEFNQTLAVTLGQGWKIAHDGEPIFG